jgi:peroxiredoxin
MPTVKAAFDKYAKKGFGIVGISLDSDENSWKKSIKDMNMTWTHMSDLKGVDCQAAILYGIQSIPYTLLIDQEGTILARNIRGEAIEKKLEELLK